MEEQIAKLDEVLGCCAFTNQFTAVGLVQGRGKFVLHFVGFSSVLNGAACLMQSGTGCFSCCKREYLQTTPHARKRENACNTNGQ